VARALSAILAVAFTLCGAQAARAADWQGDGSSGRLEFSAVQAGAKFTGRFTRFRVEFALVPTAPERGRLHVTVATASADSQDADRDGTLRSQDFFWSERHPEAVFHAQGFERDGAGWRARGTLSLRGARQPVIVHFTAAPGKDRLALKGRATLRRLAFGVGQGDWSSTEWIGDEVEIAFDLSLQEAPAGTSP
jgi:polyisoprenoid-binding protein YceI